MLESSNNVRFYRADICYPLVSAGAEIRSGPDPSPVFPFEKSRHCTGVKTKKKIIPQGFFRMDFP
jgi:hypothetical protein